MSRPHTIDKLPPEIKAQLKVKLLSSNFSNYDHLVFWLNELGYSVSRSAIYRYASSCRTELLSVDNAARLPIATLRVKCLEIVLENSSLKDMESAKEEAENLLKWAMKA